MVVTDGLPAAMLAGSNQFVTGELWLRADARHPAGVPWARTRLAAAGGPGRCRCTALHVGTYLHVDANNSTGSLDLYEAVGTR